MSDVRRCLSPRLRELVRKDPLCALYKRIDEIDPAGQHLLVMVMPLANVENIRQIMVSRIEVLAKMKDNEPPFKFLIEIPHADWDTLKRVE